MEYKLDSLKRLAVGGQAEIFEVDENTVLRVLRNPEDEGLLKTEYEVMKMLKAAGLDVPEVYEYLIVDGRPALLVERIKGVSMMEVMLKNPLKAVSYIKLLAKLHCEILSVKAPKDLRDVKKQAAFLTGKSNVLNESKKEFVQSVISQVPEGESLCHGDFHPGNILISGNRYCVIDWFGATKGAPASDVADTYLLFKSTSTVPGMSGLKLTIIKFTGKVLAREYFKTVRKIIQFSDEEFSRWLVIRAAERSYYGFEGEKQERARFIERCSKNLDDIKRWRRYL